jgi:hypothetical protein
MGMRLNEVFGEFKSLLNCSHVLVLDFHRILEDEDENENEDENKILMMIELPSPNRVTPESGFVT